MKLTEGGHQEAKLVPWMIQKNVNIEGQNEMHLSCMSTGDTVLVGVLQSLLILPDTH